MAAKVFSASRPPKHLCLPAASFALPYALPGANRSTSVSDKAFFSGDCFDRSLQAWCCHHPDPGAIWRLHLIEAEPGDTRTAVDLTLASAGEVDFSTRLVGPARITGSNGDDTITGGSGLDTIWGGSGNDALYGLVGSWTANLATTS